MISLIIITRILLGRLPESKSHVKDAGVLLVQVMLALSPGDRFSSLTDTCGVVRVIVGIGTNEDDVMVLLVTRGAMEVVRIIGSVIESEFVIVAEMEVNMVMIVSLMTEVLGSLIEVSVEEITLLAVDVCCCIDSIVVT